MLAAAAVTGALVMRRQKELPADVTLLRVERYSPNGGFLASYVGWDFMRRHPGLVLEGAWGMTVEGLGAEPARLTAIAGGTGPDILALSSDALRKYIDQGFLAPLNPFLGEDRNGNGQLDPEEAVWEPWRRLAAEDRAAVTLNGQVYALPGEELRKGLLVRRDLFRQAGLDPDAYPRDWEAFYRLLQRLTDPRTRVAGARFHYGQRGISLTQKWWDYPLFFWAAGANLVEQGHRDPRDGRVYWFPLEAFEFRAPDGRPLDGTVAGWRCAFASAAGLKAVEFVHRLVHAPWLREPVTGRPIDLSADDLARGWVVDRQTGRRIAFAPGDVIRGVARVAMGGDNVDLIELFNRGEVAVVVAGLDPSYLKAITVNPLDIDFWPFPPAEPGGRPAILRAPVWQALSRTLVEHGSARQIKLAWGLLQELVSPAARALQTRLYAEEGHARLLSPEELRSAGLAEYIDEVPPHWRQRYAALMKLARTEVHVNKWDAVLNEYLGRQTLGFVLADARFDFRRALKQAEDNGTILVSGRPSARVAAARPAAHVVFAAVLAVLAGLGVAAGRQALRRRRPGRVSAQRDVAHWAMPALLLLPAVISVLLWSYYPLLKGAVMAFQDYRLVGPSRWVGLDNFISLFVEGRFLYYLRITLVFAGLSLLLNFLVPIGLALLLNEVIAGKQFFRTVFYLPQVTSGLVIMFLWKLMYHPSDAGLLNQVIGWFGLAAQDWLGDSRWALAACVLPGAWAQAGAGSLIYLAALKTVPEEIYEAAEIDGAGILAKLLHVTLPTLRPLIVINFISAFIGTFHAMQQIFVMTAGGPGDSTMVLSLNIWYEAFVYLRFGYATAAAWVLGTLLIAFTIWQVRMLQRVEFRTATEN